MYSESTTRYYLSAFEEVLGLSLDLKSNNEIFIANLQNVISEIDPPSIRNILSPLNLMLTTEILEKSKIGKDPFIRKNLVTSYIYKIINDKADIQKIDTFTDNLQVLSNKTYEQEPCQMSFIVFNDNSLNIEDEINNIGFDYIKFDQIINIEMVVKDKEPLKLIDSLSLSYVVNASYEILGLAKKRQNGPSIYQKMANRHSEDEQKILKHSMGTYYRNGDSAGVDYSEESLLNQQRLDSEISTITKQMEEMRKQTVSLTTSGKLQRYVDLYFRRDQLRKELYNLKSKSLNKNSRNSDRDVTPNENETNKSIQFIQLKSNRVEWFINDSLVCVLSNGKWKVQNYDLVSNIVLEYIIRQVRKTKNGSQNYDNLLNEVTPRFHKFFSQVKLLSFKKIGALLFIMGFSEKRSSTIYKDLLKSAELKKDEYRKIIKTKKGHQLNIMSCDNYLFELISALDGAVIFNKRFDILSFGELINNSIETPHIAEAGSRTLAAAKSSRYGMSIKVSEDGDISIFEDGSPIIKL